MLTHRICCTRLPTHLHTHTNTHARTHAHAHAHTGFKDEWKRKLDEAHADYKESVKSKPKISKNPGAATGLSMEELIRQQKEMLAEVCVCE